MICALPGCSAEFEPNRKTHKYCSKAHAQKASNASRYTDQPPIYEESEAVPPEAELVMLRQVNKRLYNQLEAAKLRTDDLVRVTIESARDAAISLGPIRPTPRPTLDMRRKDAEVALWHLTDWQGSKLTSSYNSEVMAERVMRFCHKAELITKIQRADHPVRKCFILFGGDMVEGLFNFPAQPFQVDATLFGQYVQVSRLIVQVVQYALAVYDHVTVVAEWGNHGRIGSKRDAVPRSDNLDRMCYELARQLLAGESRLTWEDCPEDIQRVEIGAYRALSIHGDEVGRNGFASRNTMIGHGNRWKAGAYPWVFRDIYIGHYHVHAQEPLADGLGSLYWTGSTESDNRYARDMLASSASPSQRLHFIDKDRGRVTAQYQIWLENA